MFVFPRVGFVFQHEFSGFLPLSDPTELGGNLNAQCACRLELAAEFGALGRRLPLLTPLITDAAASSNP